MHLKRTHSLREITARLKVQRLHEVEVLLSAFLVRSNENTEGFYVFWHLLFNKHSVSKLGTKNLSHVYL